MKTTSFLAILCCLSPAVASAMDISAPGATIPSGEAGELLADLTPNTAGIVMETRSKLHMNGHVLDGCAIATSVSERRRVKIEGPGLITCRATKCVPWGTRRTASRRTPLVDSTLDGNSCAGVMAEKLRLRDSSAIGNNVGAQANCVDLIAAFPPRVRNVTCGTSIDTNFPASSWGVCADD